MKTEERQLLEEIRNQNSLILARLARLEDQAVFVPSGDDEVDLSLNISAMNRADDPIQYLRDRNAQIKAAGKLRPRKD